MSMDPVLHTSCCPTTSSAIRMGLPPFPRHPGHIPGKVHPLADGAAACERRSSVRTCLRLRGTSPKLDRSEPRCHCRTPFEAEVLGRALSAFCSAAHLFGVCGLTRQFQATFSDDVVFQWTAPKSIILSTWRRPPQVFRFEVVLLQAIRVHIVEDGFKFSAEWRRRRRRVRRRLARSGIVDPRRWHHLAQDFSRARTVGEDPWTQILCSAQLLRDHLAMESHIWGTICCCWVRAELLHRRQRAIRRAHEAHAPDAAGAQLR